MLKRLAHGAVADISGQCHPGVKAVGGDRAQQVASAVGWSRFTALDTLGIDEVALLKGHGDYAAAIGGWDGAHPRPGGAARPVAGHGTDLSGVDSSPVESRDAVLYRHAEGHAGAVAAALPKARIVVGLVHVAARYRVAFDNLRQAECQRLNAARPPEWAGADRRAAAPGCAGNGLLF